MKTDFSPFNAIVLPIDFLRDHDDWYPRFQYILNYTQYYEQQPYTRNVEYKFHEIGPTAVEFGIVCGVTRQTAAHYLDELKKWKIWNFQRILDNYITVPLDRAEVLVKVAAKLAPRTRSNLVKVGLFFIGQIRSRELLGQSDFTHSIRQIADATAVNVQEVSKIVNILLDNKLMRRNVVGNAFIKKSSSYSF